jgi:hypothetical protein
MGRDRYFSAAGLWPPPVLRQGYRSESGNTITAAHKVTPVYWRHSGFAPE